MRPMSSALLLAAAIATGVTIARVDTSPGWDDTGITAGALLLGGAVFGALAPKRAWLMGLAAGVWVPLGNVVPHRNFGAAAALAFALTGAYAGSFARRQVASTS